LEKKVIQCLKIVFTIHVCTSTNNHIAKLFLQFTFVLTQIIISQNWRLYIFMFVTVNQIRCACVVNCNLSIVIWRRMFNSLKLKYTVRNNKKTKEHMKCRYMYTRIILVAVLSPTIKIFYRHLGPNLYIFVVKFSHILRWFYDISQRINTDQGNFLLKRDVRAV
jgi:hypothetical protein